MITGAGIFGFLSPIRFIEGTCLNFLTSIILIIIYFHTAKISNIFHSAKFWSSECSRKYIFILLSRDEIDQRSNFQGKRQLGQQGQLFEYTTGTVLSSRVWRCEPLCNHRFTTGNGEQVSAHSSTTLIHYSLIFTKSKSGFSRRS